MDILEKLKVLFVKVEAIQDEMLDLIDEMELELDELDDEIDELDDEDEDDIKIGLSE
jgi:hypothetical protein